MMSTKISPEQGAEEENRIVLEMSSLGTKEK